MGIFSSVTGFLGKIADGVAQAIIPGCEWKPSSLLKQVDSLLPVITNAIPGVGPFLSHAVPAIQAVFGGSVKTKKEDGTLAEIAKLPTKEDVERILQGSLKAIDDARKSLEEKLDAIGETVVKQNEMKAYDDFKGKMYAAIVFIKDNMPQLQGFIPYGGNEQIKNYITKERDHDKAFQLHHFALNNAIVELEAYLSDHSPITQQMLDLYLFGAVWLLTYDKIVMQLRSYLAQHYLVINAISDYTTCITSWNQDYDDIRRNAKARAAFLLGDPENPDSLGLIQIERQKRLTSILEATFDHDSDAPDNAHKGSIVWTDNYPRHGIGHAATHSGSTEPILAHTSHKGQGRSEDEQARNRELDLARSLRSGYLAVNMGYFDVSVRAAIEVAESWRNSLSVWESRLPLSPLSRAENLIKAAVNSEVNEDERYDEEKHGAAAGMGWKKGQTLCYAVSYVTTNGEGFFSNWSDPPITVKNDDEFVKLTVARVQPLENAFTDEKVYKKRENPHGVDISIARRVYVKMTFDDTTRTYFVGTLKGNAGADMDLWDQAANYRPA